MSDHPKIARRTLFAGLGVAAAAVIAAKLTPKNVVQEIAEATPEEPKGNGYRLTEHIKKYYRTTTI